MSIDVIDLFATNGAFNQIEFLAILGMFEVHLLDEDGEYYQCQKFLYAFHQIEFLAIWRMFEVPLLYEDAEYYNEYGEFVDFNSYINLKR